jgi:hypothetical protein
MIERTIKNKHEAQSLANLLWNQGCYHGKAIREIINNLIAIEKKWKVKPCKIREHVTP